MRFQFQLVPVEEIGLEGPNPPSLNWYFLSDGWYWMEVDGHELFRYTQAIQGHWERQYPECPRPLPYDPYMVARYWEDLLEMLPAILDPVPTDLAEKIAQPQAWQEWQDRAWGWQEENRGDGMPDWCYEAIRWWGQRTWAAIHLRCPPNLWLWRTSDSVHIRWDNRGVRLDGLPVWEAQSGEVTLPVSEFLDAVSSFNDCFLKAMEQHVAAVCQALSHPNLTDGLAWLVQEQQERSLRLEKAMLSRTAEYGWDEVRRAMAKIEEGMTGPGGEAG